jgi:hypothetical protein
MKSQRRNSMKRTMYLLALALLLAPLSMVGCGSDSVTTPGDAGGTGGHIDAGGGAGGNDGGARWDTGATDVAQDAPAPLDTQAVDGPKGIDSATHVDSTGVDTSSAVDVGAALDGASTLDTGAADHPTVIDAAAID